MLDAVQLRGQGLRRRRRREPVPDRQDHRAGQAAYPDIHGAGGEGHGDKARQHGHLGGIRHRWVHVGAAHRGNPVEPGQENGQQRA